MFQLQSDHHFRQFAAEGFLWTQKKCPRKLHGDGGTALAVSLMGQVNPGGFNQSQVVHAVVLEKAAVLDGQHCIDQNLGNVLIGDELPFGALAGFGKGSDHHRLQFVGRQLTICARDGFHYTIANLYGRGFGRVIRLRSGRDADAGRR